MKVKVMKEQKLSHAQACDLARLAAIKALDLLESSCRLGAHGWHNM
jgi:hypothetical protein